VADRIADRFESSLVVCGDAFFGFLERGARATWMTGSDRQNEIVTRAGGLRRWPVPLEDPVLATLLKQRAWPPSARESRQDLRTGTTSGARPREARSSSGPASVGLHPSDFQNPIVFRW
jgi:hypothetical protein